MRLATLVIAASLSGGCTLFFNGDDGGDDVCAFAEDQATAASQPAPLRDPGNLTCSSFGGGGCNSECGPCPAVAEVAPIPPLPPIPSWNYCGHSCEQLGQSACAADPMCRVVTDAMCTFETPCLTDFLGCFPVDTIPDASIACHGADAWDCSRSSACTAIHSHTVCPAGTLDCPRPFELCVPEGTSPGSCTGVVTCDAVTPSCPTQTTPGISGGCYTGACIPNHLCS